MKFENLYHVTVAKTASRWFVKFFEAIKPWSGKNRYDYEVKRIGWDARPFTEREVGAQLPLHTVCSPLYMGFNNYHDIPKPDSYRSFCVWRDPRDVVVSFYFSCRFSHAQIGKHPQWRKELSKLNEEQGMIWCIDLIGKELKIFDALKSYENCEQIDPNCKFIKYGDFFNPTNHFGQVVDLLSWLGVEVPEADLKPIVQKHSFSGKTGRKQGHENKNHHLRKGIAGDYVNYFTPAIAERFWEVYGKDSTLQDDGNGSR